MVARLAGGSLGLLAFAIAVLAGLAVDNPVEVTLLRAILALLVFFGIGLLTGGAVQMVLAEHARSQAQGGKEPTQEYPAGTETGGASAATGAAEGEAAAVPQ